MSKNEVFDEAIALSQLAIADLNESDDAAFQRGIRKGDMNVVLEDSK